ncbi:MAG: hypothetical protein V4671_09840, partial [Armatimonadota bacterium]
MPATRRDILTKAESLIQHFLPSLRLLSSLQLPSSLILNGRLIALAWVASACMAAPVTAAPPEVAADPAATPRPNIIIVVADDLGYADVGFQHISKDVKTPYIDSLAAEHRPDGRPAG